MFILKLLLVFLVFGVSTWLFKKAAGSLKFTELNMISLIYYYMMVFNLAGASLIYLGVREHYLVKRVQNASTFSIGYFAVAWCAIMLPLTIILVKKTMRLTERGIRRYIRKSVRYGSGAARAQGIALSFVLVCALVTLYVFAHLGYIPLIQMIKGGNLNLLRQVATRGFRGNSYVKNLLMLTLTPFVSYYCYIYARIVKSSKWRIMSGCMALLSVVVLTYNFEKSPVITYCLGLYLIEVTLGNIRSNQLFAKLVAVSAALILFFYVLMLNAGSSLFSMYAGPVGRILFTQIATLFLHFEVFPAKMDFLNGASFYTWMSIFIPNAEGIRSSRVVMTIYNPTAVAQNTAGVMNSLFVAEAWANYGWKGVILAPVIFGIVIGAFYCFFLKTRKSPALILLYVKLALQFVTEVEGGFIDIFYNAATIFLIMVAVALSLAESPTNRVKLTSVGTAGIGEILT